MGDPCFPRGVDASVVCLRLFKKVLWGLMLHGGTKGPGQHCLQRFAIAADGVVLAPPCSIGPLESLKETPNFPKKYFLQR